MNIAHAFKALTLLKKRFGKVMDPDEAFAIIDEKLRVGHLLNQSLKQVLVGAAFDRGTVHGLWLQFHPCFEHGEPLDWCTGCQEAALGFERLEAFFALPLAPDENPHAAAPPPPDGPRIIMPGSPSTH